MDKWISRGTGLRGAALGLCPAFVRRQAVPGVRDIVCRVGSVQQAEAYLKEVNCFGGRTDGRIQLDKTKTFGLEIGLAAD